MAGPVLNQVRREQTAAELQSLHSAIKSWLAHRRKRDCDANGVYIGRHKTQLRSVESVLLGAAETFVKAVANLDQALTLESGEFYDRCRELDIAILWLNRLWEFYREKFDQRDAPDPVGSVVRAADELVWSCYHEVMDRAASRDANVAHGAAPLTFIAAEHSPAALDCDHQLAGSLRLDARFPEWGKKEQELVATLPLPLLRLPPWCLHAPWWLVYVGHEVGHHVYARLKLMTHVRTGIRAAARTVVGDGDADRWRNWSDEVFADVCSVLLIGRSAVRAIAEIERTAMPQMVRPAERYPAPAVRLVLVARAAERIGLHGIWSDAAIDPETVAAAATDSARHLNAIKPVLDFLFERPLPGALGTLPDLCGPPDALEELIAGVAFWRKYLDSGDRPATLPELPTARHICAASVELWTQLTMETDEQKRQSAALTLANSTTQALAHSGPPGTRGDVQPDADEGERGRALALALLETGRRVHAESATHPHGIQD